MNVVAKFMLTDHKHQSWGAAEAHEFIFTAQYDPNLPEDQRFAKASPSGTMTIRVDNPPVVDYLSANMGKQFYFNFSVAKDS